MCLSFVWTGWLQGWDSAGWHSAELHGKASGVLCLWTQISVGQTGFDRRHPRQKNNEIRSHPSHSLAPHPSPASCPWTHPLTLLHFSSLLLFTLFTLTALYLSLALHLCYFIQHHLQFSTSQTNCSTNCLLCSHRHLLNQFILYHHVHCLLSGAYWLCNIFNHVTVNMSEVLCTCWGSIQHSLSQRDHTDLLCRGGVVKFLSGASRICCCCHSSKPQAFHFVWMRISYLRDNTKQICDITQTQRPMNTEERSQAEYKMPKMSLTHIILP